MAKIIASGIFLLLTVSVSAHADIRRDSWGETPGHQKVELYTLSNGKIAARIATYGGMLVDLYVPDRDGKPGDVIRGMDRLEDYFTRHVGLYGSIVGRYGNRIKGGRFAIDGKTYQLPVNNQGNTLHGGPIGLDQRVWSAKAHDDRSPHLTLTYTSLDGEMNFPGTLKARVTYTLCGRDLRVDIQATTDKPTVVDMFVHPWFNLRGAGDGDVLSHRLQIFANQYVQMDKSHSPTGGLVPVADTPFDFRQPIPIGTHIHDRDWQISGDPKAPGYDEQFAIDGTPGALRPAAHIEEPQSGRVLDVLTTQPDLGLYTTNFRGTVEGRQGERYGQYGAIVLETQHFGNSPNLPQFPSTVLRPGQTFHETTVFRFSTMK
ncbi:MAG TPA: aldose epimerase family protein [Rhizomicrobium sp.]|jgi:aldose 1-epimerase